MAEEKNFDDVDLGKDNSITETDSIYVSPEVIKKIVGMAVNKVDGVSGMSAGLVSGIAEKLGQRDLSKGIKVQQFDNQITIDINLIVEYGVRIPEVAEKLQNVVRQAVEETTGYQVITVNLHIQGIQLPRLKEEEEEKAEKKEKVKKEKKAKKDKGEEEDKEEEKNKEVKEDKEGKNEKEEVRGKKDKEEKDEKDDEKEKEDKDDD